MYIDTDIFFLNCKSKGYFFQYEFAFFDDAGESAVRNLILGFAGRLDPRITDPELRQLYIPFREFLMV